MDARCHIQLFGALCVTQGITVHTRFRSHKAAALLSYLALSLPQTRSREHLIELFWPDREIEVGRDNLSTTLSQLRRQLEPTGVPAKSVVVADHQQVRLNREAVSTDLDEFDQLIKQVKCTQETTGRLPLLDRLLDLYQGDLLSGNYEDWAVREQTRCRTAYLEALTLLTQSLEESGDLTGALSTARRMAQAAPYEEAAYQEQIRLHLLLDHPAAALEVYRGLERLYRKEMGTLPSPETRALVQNIHNDPRSARTIRLSKPRAAALVPSTPAPRMPIPSLASLASLASEAVPSSHLSAPSPLPLQLTRLFGRQEERESLCQRLLSADIRLVTLLGTGGVGKTRLSLAVAQQLLPAFSGRVWFVSLAETPDPSLLPYALLSALKMLPSAIASDPFERVVESLGAEPCLLILDNFEHLLWEAPEPGKSDQQFAESGPALVRLLLSRVPGLTILVTSRQALRLGGEQEFVLSALPVPSASTVSAEVLLSNESVALFTDRARAVKPDFNLSEGNAEPVARLCRTLEGVPLAIEMAAAWVRTLPPQTLVERMDRQLILLVSRQWDLPPRHRSLRATIEWSYDLLNKELRDFFAFLGVFRGGWSLEAAEAICGAGALEALSELQERSLVVMEEQGRAVRYRLLETLREFALERLQATNRWEMARQSHAAYFLTFAEEASLHLSGAEQGQWLSRLEADHDNLRAALAGENKEASLRIAVAVQHFWYVRGHWSEGRMRLNSALKEAGEGAEAPVRAQALDAAGKLAVSQGDYVVARSLYEKSLEIRQDLEDRRGIAHSLLSLGNVAFAQGDHATARPLYQESLKMRRELGDRRDISHSLLTLGNVAYHLGDYALAHTLYEESLEIRRKLEDRLDIAHSLLSLGNVAFAQGDYATARPLYEESLEIRREMGGKLGISYSLLSLGNFACHLGDYATAHALYKESLEIRRELGDKANISFSLLCLGKAAFAQGDHGTARPLFEESLRIRRELGGPQDVDVTIAAFASLALKDKQIERAAHLSGAASALQETNGSPLLPDDREQQEQNVAAVREALGENAFADAWAEGRAMTLEQAIACALEERAD